MFRGKRYGDLGTGLTTQACNRAAPECHCVCMGPGATAVACLSPDVSCALERRSQRQARTNPADGPKRIDIQGKWWFRGLFMTEVAREWPARA